MITVIARDITPSLDILNTMMTDATPQVTTGDTFGIKHMVLTYGSIKMKICGLNLNFDVLRVNELPEAGKKDFSHRMLNCLTYCYNKGLVEK